MTEPLRVALVTLGKPTRLTGGYLYHLRVSEQAAAHGARLDFVSFPDWPFPLPTLAAFRVFRQLGRLRPSAVLLDSIAAAYFAPVAWLASRSWPILGILHQPPGGIGHSPWRTRWQSCLDRVSYRVCRQLMIASQSLADEMSQDGFASGRLFVVEPGSDVASRPGPPAPDMRRSRRAAILCVANWVPMKDLESLLEAFARLPEDMATLHLVGDEDADSECRGRILERLAPLEGRVVRHGKVSREEVASLYAGADLFALASLRETYGTVYGEAMAFGLPVVGWRAGNLPHIARHGEEGLAVPPGDVAALAAALECLCLDEKRREALGSAARERSRSFPTWDSTTRRIFETVRAALV